MARQGRQPRSQQPQLSSKSTKPKAAKAKSANAKAAPPADIPAHLDLYSLPTSKKRARGDVDPEARANAGKKGKGKGKGRQQEEEDSDAGGSDEDEGGFDPNEVVQFTGVKPKGLRMGGMDDDDDDEEDVNFDDDEDLDSDEAFKDEEDMPAKPKKGKKVVPSRRADIDLDEDDDADLSDEEGAAFMDISELLDNNEYPSDDDSDSGSDDGKDSKRLKDDSDIESGDDDDDLEVDSDEEVGSDTEMEDDDEEEGEGALDKLSAFVDGLESKKRKAGGDEVEEGKKKKRVVLKERTEAYPEGEFTAVTTADGVRQDKLELDDLLASFSGSKDPRLAALRKTLKPLAPASDTTTASTSKSHLKTSGPLSAPLPGRLQDKIEREAAYEKTKEETDKWNETVRRMKGESGLGVEGARHERLTLPLVGSSGDAARGASSAEWSAKFQPTNDLESSIQSLLTAGQMQISDLQKAEKSALAALDPADVAARQAELRSQRDLMFRAERKAKRVAKIKSKAFRRIHRRGKGEDGKLSLEEMAELDEVDGGDRVTEERAKMEIARARERASLKHSSKGGRWAKESGGIEGLDEERTAAVRQMVARGEKLRQKIAGIDEDESDDGYSDGGSEENDADADYDRIRQTAFDELASLDAKDAEAAASAPKLKGVLNMKFMRDAVARGERKVQNEQDELRARLSRLDGQDEDDQSSEDDDAEPIGISEQVDGNLGRMVFGPTASSTGTSFAAVAAPTSAPATVKPIASGRTVQLSGPLTVAAASHISGRSPLSLGASSTLADNANPWLSLGDGQSGGKVSRKMNKASTGKDSSDVAKVAAKVNRHKSKAAEAREAEKEDAQVELDLSAVLAPATAQAVPQITAPSSKKNGKAAAKPDYAGDAALSSDEDDDDDHNAQRGKGSTAFKQRDLVARAFAGDNVIADFQAEKQREIERDAPREEDNTLPGWGAWSGKGVKKAKNPKKLITKIAGIAPEARKDAAFTNVIISEKKDKKASKYMLKDLPFPYTSAAQHEHKLRTPLGHEWSTSTIVRDQTLPKVQVKPGVTIRPVDKKV